MVYIYFLPISLVFSLYNDSEAYSILLYSSAVSMVHVCIYQLHIFCSLEHRSCLKFKKNFKKEMRDKKKQRRSLAGELAKRKKIVVQIMHVTNGIIIYWVHLGHSLTRVNLNLHR